MSFLGFSVSIEWVLRGIACPTAIIEEFHCISFSLIDRAESGWEEERERERKISNYWPLSVRPSPDKCIQWNVCEVWKWKFPNENVSLHRTQHNLLTCSVQCVHSTTHTVLGLWSFTNVWRSRTHTHTWTILIGRWLQRVKYNFSEWNFSSSGVLSRTWNICT